jgi:hypothetical protein
MNFPCKCAEIVIKESSFELKIDKSSLTSADSGEQLISFQLRDDVYADSSKQTLATMIVNINYESKPEEPAEPLEDDKPSN